jgi:hypothetical protein
MKQQSDFLKTVFVAAPCEMGWENMQGVNGATLSDADAVRFCSGCSLNVFNLTNMTAPEAEELLRSRSATGEKLCAGIYRREDGTVMTENCPQGLRRLRDSVHKTISRAAAFLAMLTSVSLWLPALGQSKSNHREQGLSSNLQIITVETAQSNPLPSNTEKLSVPATIRGVHTSPRFGNVVNVWQPRKHISPNLPIPMRPAVPLDANAYNQLIMAQRNDSDGKFVLAEVHYKEALKLSLDKKHGPALSNNIAKSYAAFLRKHQRQSEAVKLENDYKIK